MLKKTFITITTAFMLLTFLFVAQPEIIAQINKKDRKQAEKLVQEGNTLLRKSEFKTAINKYAEAITLYPGYADAHFWKGSAHYQLSENNQAIDDFNIALQNGYDPLQIYKARWFLYYQNKDYDAAIRDAEAGYLLEKNTSFFPLALGDIYRSKKDYEKALINYEKVAPKETKNTDLPYYMAVAYQGLGRYEKERAAANEAIKRGTKFPGESWYIVGESYLKEKKYDSAIESFERAITAKENYYEAYMTLAETYRFQGSFKKAISTLEKGLKMFENDGGYLVNLTWYHSLAGNNGEAIREGQKAVKFANNNYMAFTNLCRAYSDSGLHQQAIDTCKDALKLNADYGETHYYMARAYGALGKETKVEKSKEENRIKSNEEFKLAVKGLEASTKLLPDDTDKLYLLAGSYVGDGQYDEAITTYKEVINQNPNFGLAYFNLAYTYQFRKADKKAALETHEKLKKINPKLADELWKLLNSE